MYRPNLTETVAKALFVLSLALNFGCQSDVLDPSSARRDSSPGLAAKPGSSGDSLYAVTMTRPPSAPGPVNLLTDCQGTLFLLAKRGNGFDLSAGVNTAGNPSAPPLRIDIVDSGVNWTRIHDAGRGTAGIFDGCFGETTSLNAVNGYSGNLFLWFETASGKPSVRLTWHFDYFIDTAAGVREHFTLGSGDGSLNGPAANKIVVASKWTPDRLWSERVTGPFNFTGHETASVQPPSAATFDFVLTTEPCSISALC